MIRPALAAITLVLASLGCAPSNTGASSPGVPQVAGLIAVPWTPPPGVTIQPPPPPPPTSIALLVSSSVTAPVGSRAILSVLVTDLYGAPVPGANVSFSSADPSRGPYGLGTDTTDAAGVAWVYAIPAVQGPVQVNVTASATYAPAVSSSITVIGQ